MAGIILLFIVVWVVFGAIFFFGVLKPETTDQFKSKTRLYLAILIGGPVVFFWFMVIGAEALLIGISDQINKKRLRSFFIKE